MNNNNSFNDILIEKYSSNSFVLTGNTRPYKEDIKKLGGKFNSRLRNGPGWIFPIVLKDKVDDFLKKGNRIVSSEEIKAGEDMTLAYKENRVADSVFNKDYKIKQRLDAIDDKLDKIEKILMIFINKDKSVITESNELPELPIRTKRLLR